MPIRIGGEEIRFSPMPRTSRQPAPQRPAPRPPGPVLTPGAVPQPDPEPGSDPTEIAERILEQERSGVYITQEEALRRARGGS